MSKNFKKKYFFFQQNWLYNNETTPNFHIKIKNCSEQFALDFTNCCAQRRLLYASDFRFYSKTQHLAYIQGKFNFVCFDVFKFVFNVFIRKNMFLNFFRKEVYNNFIRLQYAGHFLLQYLLLVFIAMFFDK